MSAVDDAITRSVADEIRAAQNSAMVAYILPENRLRFRHGDFWSHSSVSPTDPDQLETRSGSLSSHGAEFVIRFDRIINSDLTLLGEFISSIASSLEGASVKSLLATFNAACAATGNIVDGQGTRSFAEIMSEALEKIEFSVGRDGSVRLPQIHVHPDTYDMVSKQTATAEQIAKIEQIKKIKTAEALEREALRKARFQRYGDVQ